MLKILPISIESTRRGVTLSDLVALVLVVGVIVFLAETSRHFFEPLVEIQRTPLSLDPINLPEYAARSFLRMLVALGLSLVFTFTYATLGTHLPLLIVNVRGRHVIFMAVTPTNIPTWA